MPDRMFTDMHGCKVFLSYLTFASHADSVGRDGCQKTGDIQKAAPPGSDRRKRHRDYSEDPNPE